MKLSEAIREGAKAHAQGRRALFTRNEDGSISSCALGAAYYAVFKKIPEKEQDAYKQLKNLWPELNDMNRLCRIARWNDTLMWSREYIADLLEEGY